MPTREDLPPNYPDPAEYGPENIERYEKDVAAWHDKWLQGEELGNRDYMDRAAHFNRGIAKKMRELPDPPAVGHAEKMEDYTRSKALEMLFDPQNYGAEEWGTRRMKTDSALEAARQITHGRGDVIILPEEMSKFGSAKPLTPKTAIKFRSLPASVLHQVRQAVKDAGASKPDDVFRAAWSSLHRLGYSEEQRNPEFEPPRPKARKKEDEKPKSGTAADMVVVPGIFPRK